MHQYTQCSVTATWFCLNLQRTVMIMAKIIIVDTTIIVFYSIVLENHLANKWRKLDDYRNGVGFYQLLSLPEIKENVETVHLMRSQSFVCYATGPIMPRVKLRMMGLKIIAFIGAWWVIGSGGDNVNYLKTGIINPLYSHLYSVGNIFCK